MNILKGSFKTTLLEFSPVTTRADLNDLQPEWNELLQRSTANNVFLTWEWIVSWWDCLSGDRQPWVLSVRQPGTGKLLGLAPLTQRPHVTRRGLRYRKIEFIGSNRAAPDHLEFIIDAEHEQTITPALVKQLVSQRELYMLSLIGLASDSPLAQLLQGRSGYRQISEEVCPYINLPADWDAYQTILSNSFRKNLRYSSRRLEKMYPGDVTYDQVTCERELDDAISTLFRLHMQVRQSHGETGAFADQRMQEFHRQVAALFLENDWLRFYRLRVGNEDIALLYCFFYNNVLYYYQSGYNLDWHKHSPGSLVIAHAIKQAIEEGASEFDFLRGPEPYKFKWADQVRKDLNVEFSSSIVWRLHHLYLGVDGLARTLRHKFESLRPE